MDLGELNLEINKCKKQRTALDNHLVKRQKLINYFELRKEIHFNKLKSFSTFGGMSIIVSLAYFPINLFLSTTFLLISSCLLTASIYKLHVFKKFEKTIKKIEENNIKFTAKMQELLQNEYELDKQVTLLQQQKYQSKSIDTEKNVVVEADNSFNL